MSKKQDLILEYIQKLDIGAKVSIRSLSDTLHVSEGTAYKAIKKAEENGLVRTRPRAGTIRISEEADVPALTLSIKQLIQMLGLSEVVPCAFDFPVHSLIIGDGSLAQLINDANRCTSDTLCIVGDREDIQHEALALGLHLLLTGNANASIVLRQAAAKKNLCILSSHHSSHYILHFIHNKNFITADTSALNRASDWMHPAEYLYYNDILSDWYRTYFPIFSMNRRYAIVNDDFDICGALNAEAIIHASFEERISDLYDADIDYHSFTIPESTSIQSAARKMFESQSELLFTEHNGKLKGYITANDILRYYHFQSNATENSEAFTLIDSKLIDNKLMQAYQVAKNYSPTFPELQSLVLKTAGEHMKRHFGHTEFTLTQGSFYTASKLDFKESLELLSEITMLSANVCLCEILLSSKTAEQWKYSFYYCLH